MQLTNSLDLSPGMQACFQTANSRNRHNVMAQTRYGPTVQNFPVSLLWAALCNLSPVWAILKYRCHFTSIRIPQKKSNDCLSSLYWVFLYLENMVLTTKHGPDLNHSLHGDRWITLACRTVTIQQIVWPFIKKIEMDILKNYPKSLRYSTDETFT